MDSIRLVMLEAKQGNLNGPIEGYMKDELKSHRQQAIEMGLLKGSVLEEVRRPSSVPADVHVEGLTPAGHDFINRIQP